MEEVYDKKTKSNHWVLTLTQSCTYMVHTTKEKGRKIEGTRAQVYFGPPRFFAGHRVHQRRQDPCWIILGFCPR